MLQLQQDAPDERSRFEILYFTQYASMLRYARTIFKAHGSKYVSMSERAEEAVQEAFAFAWENKEKLYNSPSPEGWLFRVLYFKVQEFLREDRQWTKRVLLMSEMAKDSTNESVQLRLELEDLISKEDYLLLKKLYLEGYTYTELCSELNLKKSALAMRIKRIKERFLNTYNEK